MNRKLKSSIKYNKSKSFLYLGTKSKYKYKYKSKYKSKVEISKWFFKEGKKQPSTQIRDK